MGDQDSDRERPNLVKEFFTNWRKFEGSAAEKIGLTFKNRLRALRRGCCGHHGQPGC